MSRGGEGAADQEAPESQFDTLWLVAVSLSAALVVQGAQSLGAPQAAADGVVLLSGIVATLAAMAWWSRRWRRRLSRSLDQHADQLVGVNLHSRRPDAFGGEDRSAWDRQVAVFLRKMVFGGMSDVRFRQLRSSREFRRLASKVTDLVVDTPKSGARRTPRYMSTRPVLARRIREPLRQHLGSEWMGRASHAADAR